MVTNRPPVSSVSAERGKTFALAFKKGGEMMKPCSFENAIRLQFDCLMRKVVGRTVKDHNKELARRSKREILFCEMPEASLAGFSVTDEYSTDFTAFNVFGMEVRVHDERLCEAIKQLSERRRNILLLSYYLEISDAQIADMLGMARYSIYRNRMETLKLIRAMYEGEM